MTPADMDTALASVDCVGTRDEHALIHEAAMVAWGLDYSVSPRAIDVLVSHEAFDALHASGAFERIVCGADNCLVQNDSGLGIPVRFWGAVHGVTLRGARTVWSAAFSRNVLDPELVLELMPYSPDSNYLLEQRARLAEVVYVDELTDEELLVFHTYVRGN